VTAELKPETYENVEEKVEEKVVENVEVKKCFKL